MKTSTKLFLKCLRLQNFATFENQEITFSQGFNALIGETGSGKSLILDALQIVFGGRADKKLIRKNCDFSTIEAVFVSNDPVIKDYFFKIDHPFDGDEIVIKRIIYSNDSSKSYLNFQATSAQTLTSFSKRFIDLVGQFENQKLLSDDYQIVLLDSFAKNTEQVSDYQNIYKQLVSLRSNLEELTLQKSQSSQREDYLKFQIQEFESLSPTHEDETALLAQKDHILNAEKRNKLFSEITETLSEGETNIVSQLNACYQKLNKNNNLVSAEVLQKFVEAKAALEDVSYSISKSLAPNTEEISVDDILDRLDKYSRLKRKFNTTTEGLEATYMQLKSELSTISTIDEQIVLVTNKIKSTETSAIAAAEEIHKKRITFAKTLSDLLTHKVRSLKMNGATISIKISRAETLNSKGISKIEFMAETNPGEGSHKVKEIASGGELSRILLAFRQIVSSSDSISIFLFDEIDTGIGGETALAIGQSLLEVSKGSQVLAITHLPQIAHFANKLINVYKSIHQDRTISVAEEIQDKKMSEFVKAMNPVA